MDDNLFQSWEELHELYLYNNRIQHLSDKIFNNKVRESLKHISLANNEISEIDHQTFVNCTELDGIDLRNNTCFDISFNHAREESEFCSIKTDACAGSCFLVNQFHDRIDFRLDSPSPGIFVGKQLCEIGKRLVGDRCRFSRRNLVGVSKSKGNLVIQNLLLIIVIAPLLLSW
jgi:hypothetical protein